MTVFCRLTVLTVLIAIRVFELLWVSFARFYLGLNYFQLRHEVQPGYSRDTVIEYPAGHCVPECE